MAKKGKSQKKQKASQKEKAWGCGNCWPADAAAALSRFHSLRKISSPLDKSHVEVTFSKCGSCGQVFASIFTEVVNFKGGEDPNSLGVIPISAEEHGKLEKLGSGILRGLGDFAPDRRSVWSHFPNDNGAAKWGKGLRVLPHD